MSQSVDVGADYGSLLLGGLFAFGLSGCVNVQFVVYWQIYSEESWSTKSLVVAIWLLDWLHSAFIAVALWDTIIAHYGNLNYIDTIPWGVGPTVTLTAIVTFVVQSFFIYRLYKLQRQKAVVAGPLFGCSFLRLVAACVLTAEMLKLKRYSALAQPFPSWIITLGLSLCAFVDVMNTILLCYFLRSNRSRMPSTNHIIDTMTLWTVQNGSVTGLAAITSLICWLVMPYNRVFLGVHFIVAKLYANSLLATLNARTIFRHARKGSAGSPAPQQPINLHSGHAFRNGIEAGPVTPRQYSMSLDGSHLQSGDWKHYQSISVNVEQTVESKYDDVALEVDSLSAVTKSVGSVGVPV